MTCARVCGVGVFARIYVCKYECALQREIICMNKIMFNIIIYKRKKESEPVCVLI